MRVRTFVFLSMQVALLLLGTAANATSPTLKTYAGEDTRLTAKKVTSQALHIQVGEMLEQWSKQTGVDVSADEKDGAADEEIVVSLRDMPLDKAMNAVWSLMSYRGYEWQWERTGSAPAYRYVLHQGGAGKRFRQFVQAKIEGEFNDGVALLLESASLSDEERDKIAAKNPLYAFELKHPSTISSFRAMKEGLSKEQQKKLFQDHGKVYVPLSSAGESANQIAAKNLADFKQLNPDLKPPQPTRISFGIEPYNSTFVLVVGLENDSGGEETGIFGGLPMSDRNDERLRNLWVLNGETAMLPTQEERKIPPPAIKDTVAPEGETQRERVIRTRPRARSPQGIVIYNAATGLNIPLMARLTRNGLTKGRLPRFSSEYSITLAYLLKDALERYIDHKWSDGTLLVATHQRVLNENDALTEPWALIKKGRAYQDASPTGVLTLEQIAEQVSLIPPDALKRLSILKDEAYISGSQPAWEVLQILHARGQVAQSQTPEGVPYTDIAAAVNKMLPADRAALDGVTSARFRKERNLNRDYDVYQVFYMLDILNKDHNVMLSLPFVSQEEKPAKPQEK